MFNRKRHEPHNPTLAARIEAALNELPVDQREVFLAIRDEGISYRDLAVRRDTTAGEIERTFAQALAALVEAVDG